MKIKNSAITILMITFFIILGTKVYATTGTIKDETVKLRKGPDLKTVLDYVYKGDEIEILEQEDGWYKVKATTELGKVTGYIREEEVNIKKDDSNNTEEELENKKDVENSNTSEISKETPSEEIESDETIATDVIVETPNINVLNTIEEDNRYALVQELTIKALPLINSREKAEINGNIKVIEIINDWARVESDTADGWIRKNVLKQSLTQMEGSVPEQEVQQELQEEQEEQPEQKTQEQPAEKQEEKVSEETTTEKPKEVQESETTQINKIGYVSADGLRVRKEPTTDSDEVDSLSKNDEVKIIGQIGNWYKIDLEEEIGYVSAKYISDTKIPETTSRSGSTLKNENIETEKESTEQEETKVEETPSVSTEPKQSISGSIGADVVEYAKRYLGYKYVSGGASPSKGFDCSGFTLYVYKNFGISLYRTSRDQIKNGVAVEKKDLQPGDLVIFNNDANTAIGHVGIYVGEGNFIHASNPSDGVKITTLLSGYYHKRYVGARRVF